MGTVTEEQHLAVLRERDLLKVELDRARAALEHAQKTTLAAPAPPAKELPPAREGARTKLNRRRRDAIYGSLEIRPQITAAFRRARISDSTGFDWLDRGRRERLRLEALAEAGQKAKPLPSEKPFLELLEGVEDRRDRFEEDMAAVVRNNAVDNSEDAKWLLVRCFPGRWAEKTQRDVEQALGEFLGDLQDACRSLKGVLTGEQVLRFVLQVAAGHGGGQIAAATAGASPAGGEGLGATVNGIVVGRADDGAHPRAGGVDSAALPEVHAAPPPLAAGGGPGGHQPG